MRMGDSDLDLFCAREGAAGLIREGGGPTVLEVKRPVRPILVRTGDVLARRMGALAPGLGAKEVFFLPSVFVLVAVAVRTSCGDGASVEEDLPKDKTLRVGDLDDVLLAPERWDLKLLVDLCLEGDLEEDAALLTDVIRLRTAVHTLFFLELLLDVAVAGAF